MTTHHDTLRQMQQALHDCAQGALPITELSAQWRHAASALPLAPRYGQVLGDLLDRIDASALFSEESCSFSQKDLLTALQQWADNAAQALNS
jgi:hypothetical protein